MPTAAAPPASLRRCPRSSRPSWRSSNWSAPRPNSAPRWRSPPKAARNRLPILIVGEPGTGKETIARAIHAASLRAKGPLLSLDCKAVAANIIDSELFGHEKGAFPGAFAAKIGKLVQADTAAPCCSTRSARFRPKRRSCSTACSPPAKSARSASTAAIRSTSASSRTSSRPLPDDFHAGLAERIGATTVTLPPLRDRSGDIPALARHLLTRLSEQTGLQAAVDRQ